MQESNLVYLYCLDQAEDLFGGVGQVLAGGFRGHGFFQGGYGVEDGEEGVNAVLVAEAGFRGGAAGESKDCFVVFFLRWRRHRWGLFP